MRLDALTTTDFYKTGHRNQYPEGAQLVYANLTARSDKLKNIPNGIFNGHITFFGLQYFIKHFLIDVWDSSFFKQPKEKVVKAYKRRMDTSLGKDSIPVDHLEALHDLGFLPIAIKALPEGTQVPIGVPCLVIYNTDPRFFWLTNYLETSLSCFLWKAITSATVARHYRILLDEYAKMTGSDFGFVNFQAHDFSFRGMSGPYDAALSGAAHLTSFMGTDTIAAIDFLEQYYGANAETELIGCSVPATEHSVMCMGTKEAELETFRRLVTKLYPSGIISIVSDTWDFWKVITEYAATLKNEIMARTGNSIANKVVFRPDSGDPVKIICGDPSAAEGSPAYKGAVECLWDIFGGTETKAGYRQLHPSVGLIYGDSITLERADAIMKGLMAKRFASGNIVFGVGSYTYNYNTRDSFGFAVKSTYGIVNGESREIFKDPITDNGVKKSARGLLKVVKEKNKLTLLEQRTNMNEDNDELILVFQDGKLLKESTLSEIRGRLLET